MQLINCPKGNKGFSGWINFHSDKIHIQIYGQCNCCPYHEAKEFIAKQLLLHWLGINAPSNIPNNS